jgi:hypothetical protein
VALHGESHVPPLFASVVTESVELAGEVPAASVASTVKL